MSLFSKKTTDTNSSTGVADSKSKVSSAIKSIKTDTTLLLTPVVSEKASMLEAQGQYMFAVRPNINKVTVKKAIESRFGVRVVGLNIINLPGKIVRRGKQAGKRARRVHIVVRLAKGQTLTLGAVNK